MDESIHELDVVELTAASGRWPAGTVGTVVERRDDVVLVEVDDERGHSLDFVELPIAAARPVSTPYTQPRLA